MLQILAAAGLAWGFFRVLEAPRWVERLIPVTALAVICAVLLLLPQDSGFRQSVAAGVRGLVVTAAIVGPIAGYLVFIRRLKRRVAGASAPAGPPPGHPVRIDDDTALWADLDAAALDSFSLMRRDDAGRVEAAVRIQRRVEGHHISDVWYRSLPALADLARATRDAATQDALPIVLVSDRRAEVLEAFEAAGYQATGRVPLAGHPDLVTLVWTAP